MTKVSIIVPSRDEIFLNSTIYDLMAKAGGEIEIIVVLDGPTSHPLPEWNRNVFCIPIVQPMGMRHSIMIGAGLASGKYLMKLDAHCIMSQDYDLKLQENCEDNWVVVSRRKELSPELIVSDPVVDYFYFSSPWTSSQGYWRMTHWITRDRQHSNIMLDETLTFSGSHWFMSKEHFFKRIRGMDWERFGEWSGEPEEISCKTWLGGGKVMVNKEVIHAHMRQRIRPYHIAWKEALKGLQAGTKYWSTNQWHYRTHDFDWLIDHFWPLPTKAHHCNGERYWWEEDWKKYYGK